MSKTRTIYYAKQSEDCAEWVVHSRDIVQAYHATPEHVFFGLKACGVSRHRAGQKTRQPNTPLNNPAYFTGHYRSNVRIIEADSVRLCRGVYEYHDGVQWTPIK
jgi:hypothetical protein